MRICIPTETMEAHAKVFGHFGSAPYFMIYDTEKNAFETIDNKNQHHSHGMCQPLAALNGKEIDAVICGGMGLRALQKLNEAGIKAYRTGGETVDDVVKKYKDSELEELIPETACTTHNCH